MTSLALQIAGLEARLGDLHILRGVDLEVPFGEVHALMGPNGSGKSTLCHVLMGKPGYEATGSARVDGSEMLGLSVDERARSGLFEGFQYPVEVPGVALSDLLEEMAAVNGPEVTARAAATAAILDMERFMDRPVNAGLSGGEKKRSEMLQLGALDPRVAILDEIDSGLDIDAVREVAKAVEAMRGPNVGVLVITHYSRIRPGARDGRRTDRRFGRCRTRRISRDVGLRRSRHRAWFGGLEFVPRRALGLVGSAPHGFVG
jgi:Fe-S cluster assembly ATP-binding protein